MSEISKLYGRRRGRKLREQPQQLMDHLLPQITVTLPEDGFLPLNDKPQWLEIGFGGGEHLHGQATQNPHVEIIGCEAFINGIASLLQHIHDKPVSNIKIFPRDARVLTDKLPDHSIDRAFILFPDPWPKVRHFKRRLISAAFIQVLARILKPGAELIIATDDDSYAEWIENQIKAQTHFTLANNDIHTPPQGWVKTRYQMRAERLHNICRFYVLRKNL